MVKKLAIAVFLLITISVFAGIKVGYSDFTAIGSCPTYEECAKAGYNIVVTAFAKLDGTTVSMPSNYCGPYGSLSGVKAAIASVKKTYPNFKVFISFGGESAYNTWNPGKASAASVANAIVKFVHENGFDGVDFDLEIDVNQDYIYEVANDIDKATPSILISCAPQAVVSNAVGQFVTGGWCYGYNKAIEANLFNYIWPQFYNNTWCHIVKDGVPISEEKAEFITLFLNGELSVKIPSDTHILPGIPATKSAGNGCVGYDTVNNIRRALDAFPGTMCWSTNADKANGWNVITNIMP